MLIDGKVYDTQTIDERLPHTAKAFLADFETNIKIVRNVKEAIEKGEIFVSRFSELKNLELLSPIPSPNSCRDAYAFRQNAVTSSAIRGNVVPPEFDQFPVFYFTNHQAVYGPGVVHLMPDHLQCLDFELEVAIVIKKEGKNIRAEDAQDYIGGFMIMNDLSARQFQKEEMKMQLGPTKGKDFANVFGPCLVTPDELAEFEMQAPPGHTGKVWNLTMKAFLNNDLVSEGNLADMVWTFAEIIERASYGVTLQAGDVIGSGTVGTGCLLELNGAARSLDPMYKDRWLTPGDTVLFEVTGLGELTTVIREDTDDFSILAKKKNLG